MATQSTFYLHLAILRTLGYRYTGATSTRYVVELLHSEYKD